VASIRARAEQRLENPRMMECHHRRWRPRTVHMTLSIVVGWVAFNLVTAPNVLVGRASTRPPFFWLQGMVALRPS